MAETGRNSASTWCLPPAACSAAEKSAFEARVREGFGGSDAGLSRRVDGAALLAFHGHARDHPYAIAGLKAPAAADRAGVFDRAAAAADPEGFALELGWVYVVPAHRRRGIAASLCATLLARQPQRGVFATTRPDNDAMIRILARLGFVPCGEPYRHFRRDELLRLFLRTRG